VVAAAVACVAGLGAVVALASRSRPGDGPRRQLDLPDAHLELLLWPIVFLGVAMTIAGLIIGRRSPTGGIRRQRLTIGRALTLAITFLGLALLAPRLEAVFNALRPGGEAMESSQGDAEGDDGSGGRGTERVAPGPVVLGLIAAGTLGFVALGVVLRRRAGDDDEAPTLAETLDQALAAGLDDLRGGDVDPRAAVVSAYARMERALAAAGLRRHADETSREYVERVLADDGPAPLDQPAVRALGRRYEQARFASGPVGPDARDEAIGALEAVRVELRRAADDRLATTTAGGAPGAGRAPGGAPAGGPPA
jgi:hypothetical protein